MTLEEFAKDCGVYLVACDWAYGGPIAYKTEDSPHITCAGYRTPNAAYKAWLADTFGEKVSKSLLRALKHMPAPKKSAAQFTTKEMT